MRHDKKIEGAEKNVFFVQMLGLGHNTRCSPRQSLTVVLGHRTSPTSLLKQVLRSHAARHQRRAGGAAPALSRHTRSEGAQEDEVRVDQRQHRAGLQRRDGVLQPVQHAVRLVIEVVLLFGARVRLEVRCEVHVEAAGRVQGQIQRAQLPLPLGRTTASHTSDSAALMHHCGGVKQQQRLPILK